MLIKVKQLIVVLFRTSKEKIQAKLWVIIWCMNKLKWYIHTLKYCLSRKEVLSHAAIWLYLENTVLANRSQPPKWTHNVLTFYLHKLLAIDKPTNRMILEEWEVMGKENDVSIWGAEITYGWSSLRFFVYYVSLMFQKYLIVRSNVAILHMKFK